MTALSLPWPLRTKEPASTSPSCLAPTPTPTLRRTQSFLRLLQHYEASGTTPPGARADPRQKQREGVPFSLWNLWKIGTAAAFKGPSAAYYFGEREEANACVQRRKLLRTSLNILYGDRDGSHGRSR
jgi:hypothetical protein